MKQIIYAVALFSIVGCAANSSTVQRAVGYDREVEDIQRQEAVKNEINSRNAAKLDDKTRSDLDKAIERERSK